MTDLSASRYAVVATALTAAMAAGTLTQFLMGAMGPVLIPALGMSRTEFGIVTASFFVAGAVLSPPAGRWTDRWGGQPLLVLTFMAAGFGFGVMALAQSWVGLVVGSAIAGIAGATTNPATNLLVADLAPPGQRGMMIGIKQSGVQIGAFVSGMLPALSTLTGWRGVMAACAAASVGAVALGVPIYRQGRGSAAVRTSSETAPRDWRDPITLWLGPYAVLMGIGGAAISTYLPLYAFEIGGFSASVAGLLAAVIGLVGIPARIVWARASERADTAAGPLAVIALGSAVSVGIVLLVLLGFPGILWLSAMLFGTTVASWNAVAMLAIVREAEPGTAGRVSGRVLAGFYIGLVIGPVPFGYVVDQTGSYTAGWSVVLVIYVLALLLCLLWRHRHAASALVPQRPEPS